MLDLLPATRFDGGLWPETSGSTVLALIGLGNAPQIVSERLVLRPPSRADVNANAAIAAAERARQPIGEWVSRAIRSQVQSDRQESRGAVPVRPEVAPPANLGADLAQLERLVALAASLSAAGAPPPKTVSRGAYGLIRQRLSEMKGPTKEAPGPTGKASGLTGEPGPGAPG